MVRIILGLCVSGGGPGLVVAGGVLRLRSLAAWRGDGP